MNNENILLGILALAGLLFAASKAYASIQATDSIGNPLYDDAGNPVMIPIDNISLTPPTDTTIPDDTMASDLRVAAFLAMIRQFESNDNYTALYGGGNFSGFAKHPFDGKPLPLHSAAGAYQFIVRTWKALQLRLALPDFSPSSQDAAAYELLRQVGAIYALNDNDINTALRKASSQWASLPYSTAGQSPHSLDETLATYNSLLTSYG